MTVREIAQLVGGRVQGDASREIRGVAGLEAAGRGELAFLEGARDSARLARSRAGCVLVTEGVSLTKRTTIAVARPKLAFIRVAEALVAPPAPRPGIHPTAIIASGAQLASGVSVGAQVVIQGGVRVGEETWLQAGVFLGEGVEVGSGCVFHPRVTVYPGARIGHRVILHAGVVVGSDGFGYVWAEGRQVKFPQLGRVIVEDDVEIGSNTTIDRGSLGTTVIGQGTKIDNLVQVAHNVKIGRHCVIAAQTGISGSVDVGDHVVMGGQVGVSDHVRIEDEAVIGGGAVVATGKRVRARTIVWGIPARPLAEFKRQYACLSLLPSLVKEVRRLSQRLSKRAP